MDQSQPLALTQIGERGEYTQIPSAEPVNLSKSKELSVPSQNKGEIEDARKHPILRILYLTVFTTYVPRPDRFKSFQRLWYQSLSKGGNSSNTHYTSKGLPPAPRHMLLHKTASAPQKQRELLPSSLHTSVPNLHPHDSLLLTRFTCCFLSICIHRHWCLP